MPSTDLQILLIEPDEDTRHLLELALSARGHRVTSGGDAEHAWQALKQGAYPFIVINRNLPDIDGLRLCRQVRTLPGGEQSTVIIISENANPEDRSEALEAGANDFLAWPGDAIALRAHLEKAEQQASALRAAPQYLPPVPPAPPVPAEAPAEAPAASYEPPAEPESPSPEPAFDDAAEDIVAVAPEEVPVTLDESVATPEEPAAQSEDVDDTLFVIAPDGTIRDVRATAEELLGYLPDDYLGTNAFTIFHPEDAPRLLSMLTRAFTGGGDAEASDLRFRHGDDWEALPIYLTNHLDDPYLQGFAIHVVLPEPEPEPEPELGPQSIVDLPGFEFLYDQLPRLPMFPLFMDRLEHSLARASRRGEPVVSMLIDLSGLEAADARFGEGADDQTVVAVAQRIQSCLRAGDTVARVAPHEFGIVVEGIIGLGDASLVAKRLIADLEQVYVVNGADVHLSVSLGIAVSVQDRYGAPDMLQQARAAREYGRNHPQDGAQYALYEPHMAMPEPVAEEPELILDEPEYFAGEPEFIAQESEFSTLEAEQVALAAEPELELAPRDEETAAQAAPAPDAGTPPVEAWFMPLIERISSLEREISRLSTEHASLKDDAEAED